MYRLYLSLLLYLVFFTNSTLFAMFENEDVERARASLSPHQRFIHFDLQLSAEDQALFEKLSIKEHSRWNYENFGELDSLQTGVASYLKSVGENEPSLRTSVATLINQITHKVVAGFGTETAWVSVRATTPNSTYDVANWHRDPLLTSLEPRERIEEKVVMAFKGPRTLFCNPPEATWKDLDALSKEAIRSAPMDLTIRKKIDTFLKERGCSSESTPFGHATIFRGGKDVGAFHSVPPQSDPGKTRLFMSIFPNTVEEIENIRGSLGY